MRKLLLALIILWPCYGAWALEGFLKQSTATTVTVTMVSTTDGYSGKTGLTLTIWAVKNGSGAGAAITPTVTEVNSGSAPGVYALALTTGHTNTLGELHLYVTGTGAIPTDCKWQISARLEDDLAYPATSGRSMVVDAAGLVDANMVKAGPSGSGTAQTAGDIPGKTNSLTFTVSNQLDANLYSWKGGTIPSPNVTGVPLVDNKYLLGTIFTTPATAGIMDINVKNINNVAASTPGASGGILISGSNSGTTTLGALTITGAMSINGTGNVAQTGDSYARIGSAGAGLTAIFANNIVDSTGGGLTAGNALMYIMSAVFNTAPQTAGTDDVLALKKFDGTTGLATQTIAGAGTGRTTSIP